MKYELTAESNSDGIRAVATHRYRTRKAAEEAAHRMREFGWATQIRRL